MVTINIYQFYIQWMEWEGGHPIFTQILMFEFGLLEKCTHVLSMIVPQFSHESLAGSSDPWNKLTDGICSNIEIKDHTPETG